MPNAKIILGSKRTDALTTAANQYGWRIMQDAVMRILDHSELYGLAHQD